MKFLCAACILALSLIAPANALADTLKVVTLHSPPLAFEQDGHIVGITADLVREGLRRMGHEADIMIVPWVRGIAMVREGHAHAIFQAGRNAEREQWFHYPEEPLYEVKAVPVQRMNDPRVITPQRFDYSDSVLGTVRGGYFGPNFKAFLDKATFKRIEEFAKPDANFKKLAEGRIDAYVTTFGAARHYIRTNDLQDVLTIAKNDDGSTVIFDRSQTFLAFSKKVTRPKLAQQFSEALREMQADGTTSRILTNYLGSRIALQHPNSTN